MSDEYWTRTPHSDSIFARVAATTSSRLKPLSTPDDPVAGSARTIPSPMPLLEPVTRHLPVKPLFSSCIALRQWDIPDHTLPCKKSLGEHARPVRIAEKES